MWEKIQFQGSTESKTALKTHLVKEIFGITAPLVASSHADILILCFIHPNTTRLQCVLNTRDNPQTSLSTVFIIKYFLLKEQMSLKLVTRRKRHKGEEEDEL